MNTPITSRIKRDKRSGLFAKYSSMAKSDHDKDKVNIKTGGGKKTVKKTVKGDKVKKTYTCDMAVKDGKFNTKKECLDAVKKEYGTTNPTKEGKANNVVEVDGPDKEVEETVNLPADYDPAQIQRQDGTARSNYQTRQFERRGTQSARKINQAERRLEKFGGKNIVRNDKGEIDVDASLKNVQSSNLSARQKRKFRQNIANLKTRRQSAENIRLTGDQQKVAGDKLYMGDRDMTLGDLQGQGATQGVTPGQKKAIETNAEMDRQKKQSEAEKNNLTTTTRSSDQAIDPLASGNAFAQAFPDILDFKAGSYDPMKGTMSRSGNYSGMFMKYEKPSIAKMSYSKPAPTKRALVGDQHKLNDNLKKAIKAAAPLKKNYFKNK